MHLICPHRCRRLLLAALMAGEAALGAASAANVAADRVLYSFDLTTGRDPDLENPLATFNRQGRLSALYGTTSFGGEADRGVIFKLTRESGLQVIHSFGVAPGDGVVPYGTLIADDTGNLYGTTSSGYGGAVLYKLAPDGSETILHTFTGRDGDGAAPYTGVVMDRKHDLYGSTFSGGRTNQGTLFRFTAGGVYSVIYTFNIPGRYPAAGPLGIVVDDHDTIYGVSEGGRTDWGLVYRLDGEAFEPLHQFTYDEDGGSPGLGLLMDSEGNLYGTTQFGGPYGGGGIFKLTKAGVFSILYWFKGQPDGADPDCQLIADSNGVLYGATRYGGIANAGTVFSLAPSGEERILHSFRPRVGDGANPTGGLAMDHSGHFYGTTNSGGAYNYGTVFEVTPR